MCKLLEFNIGYNSAQIIAIVQHSMEFQSNIGTAPFMDHSQTVALTILYKVECAH